MQVDPRVRDALEHYESALDRSDVYAVEEALDVLCGSGDYDKIAEILQNKADKPNFFKIGTLFTAGMANCLVRMAGHDPVLACFGKHINIESWQYANNPDDRCEYITMREYITGVDGHGKPVKSGGIVRLMQGVPLGAISPTLLPNIQFLTRKSGYFPNIAEGFLFDDKLTVTLLPELMKAMPNFEPDSPQIIDATEYLTGLRYENGEWQNTAKKSPATLVPRTAIVRAYLRYLKPADLLAMQDVVVSGVLAAFDCSIDVGRGDALKVFRDTQVENIEYFISAGEASYVSMRPAVREALGFA